MRRSPGAIFAVTAFTAVTAVIAVIAVIAVKAYNDGVEERAVATLTIRDLDCSIFSLAFEVYFFSINKFL